MAFPNLIPPLACSAEQDLVMLTFMIKTSETSLCINMAVVGPSADVVLRNSVPKQGPFIEV
jgi:hypothetical protein